MKNYGTKLILTKIREYKTEIFSGLVIQIIIVFFGSLLSWYVTKYALPSSVNDVYGLSTIVILPGYFLWKAVRREKIYGKHTATWMIFSATLVSTALVDGYISNYYHTLNLQFLFTHLSFLGLQSHMLGETFLGLLSTPLDLLISVFMYHVLISSWPHTRTKNKKQI